MKQIVSSLVIGACLLLPAAGAAIAASNPSPSGTGQPSQTCQTTPGYPAVTPGNSYTAPGSAFNPGGKAGSVYAGTQPQNSGNPTSVSQYDVACYQNSQIP